MSEEVRLSRSSQLARWVGGRIMQIANTSDTSYQKRVLAELRRGVGRKPGELPSLWGVIFENFPAEWMSYDGSEPSREEWAVYIALTLFALHQRGKSVESDLMHQKGYNLGRSNRIHCGADDDERERCRGRFERMAMAKTITGVEFYLRQMVTFLSRDNIPLDYASLAVDIFQYQSPNLVDAVRLRWAQNFYNSQKNED